MTVELFSRFLSQLGHHVAAVGVEQVHEALENVQMEGGCDQLTVGTPLLAGRDQQSVAKPRLEEPVLGTLVNVDAASKDQLNKTTKSPSLFCVTIMRIFSCCLAKKRTISVAK